MCNDQQKSFFLRAGCYDQNQILMNLYYSRSNFEKWMRSFEITDLRVRSVFLVLTACWDLRLTLCCGSTVLPDTSLIKTDDAIINNHIYGIRQAHDSWPSSSHRLPPPSGLWLRRWRRASPSNPSTLTRSRCTSVTLWASPPSQLSAIPSRWSTCSTTSTHSLMLSLDCTMSTRWVLFLGVGIGGYG